MKNENDGTDTNITETSVSAQRISAIVEMKVKTNPKSLYMDECVSV